jgi:hypothetical protein
VHELELFLGLEAHLLREVEPLLLRIDTSVKQFLDVIDTQHASHHLLGAKRPQSLKVEVPKVLVPPPSLMVTMGVAK